MKFIAFIATFLIAIIAYSDYKKEKRLQLRTKQEQECAASVQCSNKKSDENARWESITSMGLTKSNSGNIYFRGTICSPDCNEHISGYLWAERIGISKKEGCDINNSSFINGCRQYVDIRIEELINQNDEDEQESCKTYGRYSDC
jgi:hypothetical protein